ncbi:MAG TPA: glycosyltransferase [Gemmatimonadales bacterium]
MRVLAVAHSYPRFDGDLAGAFLERLYEALITRGHSVRVIAPADEGRGGEERRHGLLVERVRYATPGRETLAYHGTMTGALRSPAGLLAFRGLVRALARAVRSRAADADVIHANWWVPGGWAVWRARHAGTPPCVLTLHGTDATMLRRSWIARRIARPVLGGAATVTTVSTFLAGIAKQAGARTSPVVLPMPAEAGTPPPANLGGRGVVTVGRLTRQKRIHVVIEAIARLAADGRVIPLTIVGDGPERLALERMAGRLGVREQVRFTGAVSPSAVHELLAGADAFAFPARHEGFGLAAAEALMAGVPIVVAADGGGVLDIARPDAAAAIVPGLEPAAWAAAIGHMLGNAQARAAAAAEGAEWRRRLDPGAVAEQLEGVLEHACGRP